MPTLYNDVDDTGGVVVVAVSSDVANLSGAQ